MSASHTLPQFERDWEQINSYFGGHVLSRIEREKCGCWCYERPLDIRDDGQLSESYVIRWSNVLWWYGVCYICEAKLWKWFNGMYRNVNEHSLQNLLWCGLVALLYSTLMSIDACFNNKHSILVADSSLSCMFDGAGISFHLNASCVYCVPLIVLLSLWRMRIVLYGV